MTFREKLICRILLIIARMVADDPVIDTELKHLASHINVTAKERA